MPSPEIESLEQKVHISIASLKGNLLLVQTYKMKQHTVDTVSAAPRDARHLDLRISHTVEILWCCRKNYSVTVSCYQ